MLRLILYLPFAVLESMAALTAGVLGAIREKVFNPYDFKGWLKQDLADCNSILEIGCGSNSPILQIGYGKKTTAIDIFEPYVRMHNEAGDYKQCIHADAMTFAVPKRKYDALVICDMLEHLDCDGQKFLDKVELAATKKIVLFTPNGFVENDQVDGNKWQEHHMGWEPGDYLKRGYSVKGSQGWRWIVGKAGLPKRRPYCLWAIVVMLSLPLMVKRPEWAGHSYAVKEL